MDIVVFGVGRFYSKRKDELNKYGDEIVAFLDNRAVEIREVGDKLVLLPENILRLKYDLILLMSIDYKEMKKQLLELGVKENEIYDWRRYKCERTRGELKIYPYANNDSRQFKKKVLIVSEVLNYNGASLAVLYAAKTLQNLGYDVTLSAAGANEQFLNEVKSQRIRVILALGIPYIGEAELDWMRLYDVIIVNVFQMIKVAYLASKDKPVLWWIHEPSDRFEDLYRETIDSFLYENENIKNRRIYICPVSDIAKMNFEKYHPGIVSRILPYGILDERRMEKYGEKDELIFAIIGPVMEIKGQIFFVDAISMMPNSMKNKSKFKIIGSLRIGSDYYNRVNDLSSGIPQIQLVGELTRRELNEMFSEIDVVVCASLEETMSLTITEGMMHGKICITTDATGMADYITDGENGFVCAAGDAAELSEKMQYVIEHFGDMQSVRNHARDTYEKYFTLEALGERLEKAISETEKYFAGNDA